jgi:hypothetical protein
MSLKGIKRNILSEKKIEASHERSRVTASSQIMHEDDLSTTVPSITNQRS